MSIIHISLAFAELPDAQLDEFAANTVIKMTGNAAFPTPAVTLASLGAAQTAFHNALAATTQGGTMATAAKNSARTALISLLRVQAIYVQAIAANNLATLLSSGFLASAAATNAQSPLGQTAIMAVANNGTTRLQLKLQPVLNAKSYEIQVSTDGTTWIHAITTTQSRTVMLENLVPGTSYQIRARAVGGSTGFGNWSDPVTHMAT
jgi:hypothetical protein